MTEIVTATVVEVPKPERPTLYVAIGDFTRDTGEREWCSCVGEDVETAKEMLSWAGDCVKLECVATVPGSTSPPAGDAIAELCGPKHQGFIEWNRCWNPDVKGVCRGVFAAGYDNAGKLIEAYGPDPQSAARACLDAIRKAGG